MCTSCWHICKGEVVGEEKEEFTGTRPCCHGDWTLVRRVRSSALALGLGGPDPDVRVRLCLRGMQRERRGSGNAPDPGGKEDQTLGHGSGCDTSSEDVTWHSLEKWTLLCLGPVAEAGLGPVSLARSGCSLDLTGL